MKLQKLFSKIGLLLTVFAFFMISFSVKAQSVSMGISGCSVTANEINFDVTVTNLLTTDLRYNAATLRIQFAAGILPSTGTNTVTWGYVGDSDFPLSFPSTGGPTFSYTSSSRQCSVNTGTGVYNNATCSAPLIGPGQTKKIGRFFIRNSQNFVNDQQVGLTWVTSSGLTLYSACSTTTVGYNTSGTRTLLTPCTLSTLPSCINTSSSQTVASCDSYTWSANGQTYTSSGTYTSVTNSRRLYRYKNLEFDYQ